MATKKKATKKPNEKKMKEILGKALDEAYSKGWHDALYFIGIGIEEAKKAAGLEEYVTSKRESING
jgi:hypothetical protein